MHAPVRIAAPAETPVSYDEAKAHLNLDHDDHEALVEGFIAAATSHLDGYSGILGRALVTQTWRQDFDAFAKRLRLPLAAASISAIRWRNDAGQLATITASAYSLLADELGSYVWFSDAFEAPTGLAQVAAVSVEFEAGTAPVGVPPAIRQAILLLVGHWYETREAVNIGNIVTALPFAVDALLAPWRRVGV